MIIDLYYKGKFVDTYEDIDDAQLYVEEQSEDFGLNEDDFTYRKHKGK